MYQFDWRSWTPNWVIAADQAGLVTKGFEPVTYKRMTEVLGETLPITHLGTLLGPNITLDLVNNLPTEL